MIHYSLHCRHEKAEKTTNEETIKMALIKFGGGVAAISGKIAGTVFARNKAGAYARNWAKPVNPVTAQQSLTRGIFGNASASWGNLTSNQREAWNGEAQTLKRTNRFGEDYTPSGRQFYLEIYNSLAQQAQPALVVPVVAANPPLAPTLATLEAVETAGVLTILAVDPQYPYAANELLVIEAAPIQPDTKTNVNTQYRQLGAINASVGSVDILAQYVNVFGNVAATGNSVRLRLSILDTNTGLRSPQVLVQDDAS